MKEPFRLTKLAHGGGCGCKLAPAVLQKMLAVQPEYGPFKHLLVGTQTKDDAAVYAFDDNNLIIATTDFFMPMVDDPKTFGQIAAANAISDIYAMGGRPVMALAILGMPIDRLSPEIIAEILHGGCEKAAEAGIPVAGGHSIDCPEPVYGLAVIGLCKHKELRRNDSAQAGDKLILLKGLGVGIYSAAFKKQALTADAYQEMVASMTLLNKIGAGLGCEEDVHAMTDVTGFGILGHALEMAKGSRLAARIDFNALPFFSKAHELAQRGFITGASKRNWESYGGDVLLPPELAEYEQHLLTDPQTSGGLLLAVKADSAKRIIDFSRDSGYSYATQIGEMRKGVTVVEIKRD